MIVCEIRVAELGSTKEVGKFLAGVDFFIFKIKIITIFSLEPQSHDT